MVRMFTNFQTAGPREQQPARHWEMLLRLTTLKRLPRGVQILFLFSVCAFTKHRALFLSYFRNYIFLIRTLILLRQGMGKVILYSLMGEGEPGKHLLMYRVAACESLLVDPILALR